MKRVDVGLSSKGPTPEIITGPGPYLTMFSSMFPTWQPRGNPNNFLPLVDIAT
jgi:hypothetical protein